MCWEKVYGGSVIHWFVSWERKYGMTACGKRYLPNRNSAFSSRGKCAKCEKALQPRPMTLAQARAKAKERWGESANAYNKKIKPMVRAVGVWINYEWQEKGVGPTFEEAFADADRREAEAKEKMSNEA